MIAMILKHTPASSLTLSCKKTSEQKTCKTKRIIKKYIIDKRKRMNRSIKLYHKFESGQVNQIEISPNSCNSSMKSAFL